MLIVPQKNFVFINKEVSTFKKRWMFLQILFNTLVQLQIKEKIQEDKGPLMELSTCQQNLTLGKKNTQLTKQQPPPNHFSTCATQYPQQSESAFVSSPWKKGFKNKTNPGTRQLPETIRSIQIILLFKKHQTNKNSPNQQAS